MKNKSFPIGADIFIADFVSFTVAKYRFFFKMLSFVFKLLI